MNTYLVKVETRNRARFIPVQGARDGKEAAAKIRPAVAPARILGVYVQIREGDYDTSDGDA